MKHGRADMIMGKLKAMETMFIWDRRYDKWANEFMTRRGGDRATSIIRVGFEVGTGSQVCRMMSAFLPWILPNGR